MTSIFSALSAVSMSRTLTQVEGCWTLGSAQLLSQGPTSLMTTSLSSTPSVLFGRRRLSPAMPALTFPSITHEDEGEESNTGDGMQDSHLLDPMTQVPSRGEKSD